LYGDHFRLPSPWSAKLFLKPIFEKEMNEMNVESRTRRWLRWPGWALGLVLWLLALAGVACSIYQVVASAADRRNYPPPGILVDVGGRRLHLWCAGSGSPMVVLESGLGGFSYDWSYIREDITGFTRVCAYDRAGFGWSDPVEHPLSSVEVAEDLHELLTRAGEAGPYVIVGHSYGGILVRSFARLYPDEVVGIILVDSAHENHGVRLNFLEPLLETQQSQLKTCTLLSSLGLMRLLKVHHSTIPEDVPISAEAKATWLARLYQNTFCGAMLREIQAYQSDIWQTTPPASLGDIPLVVLTRGRAILLDELPSSEKFTQEAVDEVNRISLEMQDELAGLSTNCAHRIVSNSGHYIHWDQPAVVLETIQEIVTSLQP